MNSICKNTIDTVDYGDYVALYTHEKMCVEVELVRGGKYENHNGIFLHSIIVGRKFGEKIYSDSMRGWIYLLRTSSTLHTFCLNHRTQILYSPDISMVLFQLDIKPGWIVVESGTGSGSLSTSIGKTVLPTGHLYTFEFNEHRVKMAQKEFKVMGLDPFVTWTHRDVLEGGFEMAIEMDGFETNLDDKADAVFLDLPSPWKALHHAHKVLKHNGRICNFSPCIEQVQKVWLMLDELKYSHIRTFECISRSYSSKNRGYEHPDYSEKEEGDEDFQPDSKNIVQDSDSDNEEDIKDKGNNDQKDSKNVRKRDWKWKEKNEGAKSKLKDRNKILISELTHNIKGHTGYLTFATWNKSLGKIASSNLEIAGVKQDKNDNKEKDEESKVEEE